MKTPPPFVLAALELESTFAEIEALAGSLTRLELDGDTALDRARRLLVQFSNRSQSLGDVLAHFAQAMEDRRAQLEAAVQAVQQQAPRIQQLGELAEAKMARFQALTDSLRTLTQTASALGPTEVAAQLRQLREEAGALEQEASAAGLKTLARNAQNMRKELRSLTKRLEGSE